MISYFALRRDLAYEGDGNFFRAIHPTPVLTRATLPGLGPTHDAPGCPSPLFREDSFDPVTRVRRGRLYVLTNPSSLILSPDRVHNYPYGPHIGVGGGWQADGYYKPVRIADFPAAQRIESMEMALGDAPGTTFWRVAAAERISSGELLFILRARSSMGALPALADALSARDGSTVTAAPIHEALDQLVDAFHRQQPVPIADVCRETARVILAAWIGANANTEDLAKVIGMIPKGSDERIGLVGAATVINRLRSRGKSSVQERQAAAGQDLRFVCMEDAEASVQLVGFLLRDIGWAAA